ncbi:hypothetical protein WCWAEYFT_CDS0132 [Vibrio phage VB_VaC_TDDLMA]
MKAFINQGFGKYTEVEIISHDKDSINRLGNKDNYKVKITGGVDCFGKPAKVDQIQNVHASNIVFEK